jgi:antiviral helicase SKI2
VPNPRLATGLTSTSLERAPGPSTNFVRGKSGYVPFWPGGLDEILKESPGGETNGVPGRGPRNVPPGLSRGLRLPGEEAEDEETLAILDQITDGERKLTVNDEGPVCDLWSHYFTTLR